MTNRQLQAAETKEKIVKIAKELFKNNGYDSVSIDDICKRCSISKGAFYHHFASKDDIILWIYRTENEEAVCKALRPYIGVENTLSLLRRYIEAGYENNTIETLRQYLRILSTRKNGKEAFETRESYKLICSFIEAGKESGELRSDLSFDYCIKMLLSCITGIYLYWCIYDGEYNLNDFAMNVLQTLYDAIKA